ncbi:MAG: cation:proton antiporter [Saprospiraceae bacterium]|nr:cation:proton antiporter [Saprospiraceae bacterium]
MTLFASLDLNNAYVLLILASAVIIISHFFNVLSAKTRVPSVLMLILLGIGLKQGLMAFGVVNVDMLKSLELLGIVGLIMIVLEAALDLQLTKEELPLIGKAFLVASISLVLSTLVIALIIQAFITMSYQEALLYSTPLSIMSSAIIIPSVAGLLKSKKEFMVYESAFSDILGIMMFYFVISLLESGGKEASIQFGASFFITIVVAIVSSYLLVYLFKDMKGHVRLFLLIAVLLFLYSFGKLLHLSPLLVILIFGMSLSNHQSVFKIFRNYFINEDEDPIGKIEKEFHLITMETAFVVRTFFFVIFGMSIDLLSLVDLNVFLISALVLLVLYLIRFAILKALLRPSILPELWIAPRGLITILLFYAIPPDFQKTAFSPGVLLYVIIISSVIMSIGLIRDRSSESSGTQIGEGTHSTESQAS